MFGGFGVKYNLLRRTRFGFDIQKFKVKPRV